MSISKLRRIAQDPRKSEPRRQIWFGPIFRFLSIYITNLLLHTNITPNQVTLMSACFGVIGGVCFSFGSGVPSIFGSFALLLAYLLDNVDGEIARYKKMCSLTGLTFDMFAQGVIFISALVGISIGSLKESGDFFSVIGFLAAIIYLLSATLSSKPLIVAVEAKFQNEDYKFNIKDKATNEQYGKKNLLEKLKIIVSEYLKVPNQKLIFLILSITDAIKDPIPINSSLKVSYLMIYVSLLFLVFLGGLLFKIIMIAKKMETDRIFEQLK